MGDFETKPHRFMFNQKGNVKYVKNVKYKFVGISDHAVMMVKMGVNEEERGGGMLVF